MGTTKSSKSNEIRAIALSVFFVVAGFSLRALMKILFDVTISKDIASVFNFALAAFGAYYVYPKLLKEPFGNVSLSEYTRLLGVFLPPAAWKHIVLGGVLALCTLGGLLVSALLTGRYVVDWSTLSFSHFLFSINPAVWEEVFYRGIMMFVLLRMVKSVRKAAIIQIVIFGLSHIKGIELWSLVDTLSVVVLAIAFTYVTFKTRALLAGMVFHFLHDAFIFFVQVPEMELFGVAENVKLYAILWVMVGVACWLSKLAAEKFAVQADGELYKVFTSES